MVATSGPDKGEAMSDVSELTCPQCQETFLENQLRMKQLTRESCPSCDFVFKMSEGWGSTNVQLLTASDIQAIDTWLDNHSQATGKRVVQRATPEHKRERVWSIETEYPFACEVCYGMKQPETVKVRFLSNKQGEAMFADESKLQRLAARHGLEPCGYRNTEIDGSGTTVTAVWGVQQRISVNVLCEDWFAPLLQRLNAAMNEAQATIAKG